MKFIGAGSRPGQPQVHHDAVFTIPNLLTVLRFMGVPLFIWLVLAQKEYGFAVLVLAIMASTDWVDGYIARRFNQTSKLGRVMDPIADRLALIAVAVTLVIAGVVAVVVPGRPAGARCRPARAVAVLLPRPPGPARQPGRQGPHRPAAGGNPAAGALQTAHSLRRMPTPSPPGSCWASGSWATGSPRYNYFWAILRKGQKRSSSTTPTTAASADGLGCGSACGPRRLLPRLRCAAPGQCGQGRHRRAGAQLQRHSCACCAIPGGSSGCCCSAWAWR